MDDNQHLLQLEPFVDAQTAAAAVLSLPEGPVFWLSQYALLIDRLVLSEQRGIRNVSRLLEHAREVHSILAAHCNGRNSNG